jgi:hypothetical protein
MESFAHSKRCPSRWTKTRNVVLSAIVGMAVLMSSPLTSFAGEVGAIDEEPTNRTYFESVVRTYWQYYSYNRSDWSVSQFDETYFRLEFKTSYARVYPDTRLSSQNIYCQPITGASDSGLLMSWQCNYKTW